MRQYRFLLTSVLPCNDIIYDSVLIQQKTGLRKSVFLYIWCSGGFFWMIWKCWLPQKTCNKIILLSFSTKSWLCFWQYVFDVFSATHFHYWDGWSSKLGKSKWKSPQRNQCLVKFESQGLNSDLGPQFS